MEPAEPELVRLYLCTEAALVGARPRDVEGAGITTEVGSAEVEVGSDDVVTSTAAATSPFPDNIDIGARPLTEWPTGEPTGMGSVAEAPEAKGPTAGEATTGISGDPRASTGARGSLAPVLTNGSSDPPAVSVGAG